jgi:hypothetical protein
VGQLLQHHIASEGRFEISGNEFSDATLLFWRKDFQICIGDDEWIQELNEKYFILISKLRSS